MNTSFRNTKIIATLGPSSHTHDQIKALVEAGANLFRLNFSHSTHKDHQDKVAIIHAIEEEIRKPLGIIADLQGPKLRIGEFETGQITLETGQTFVFDQNEKPGNSERVCLPHKQVFKALKQGDLIYLDDGKVRMEVTDIAKTSLTCKVLAGKSLSNHKGFNLPNTLLPIPALTNKDKEDLDFALNTLKVDWIAQSFVQTPDDVKEAYSLIGGKAGLIVKIEKPSALDHFEEICELTDAIMLARGDLGVEIPPEDVPSVQKRVVRYARWQGKPVIVATQMLESMIHDPMPTRAEASDVATAIYDGTDAVMLSGETAAGNYPVEAVDMMARIAESVEADPLYRSLMNADHPYIVDHTTGDAITVAAEKLSEDIQAHLIVCYTSSGSTALRIARQRPQMPVLCMTQDKDVARRLCLSYAICPVYAPDLAEFDSLVDKASIMAKYYGVAKSGDKAVLTAGTPFGKPGTTNTIRVFDIL